MKREICNIINDYTLLSELASKKLPLKMSWWVSQNIKRISQHYNFFTTERNKLYLEFCEVDENDSFTKEVAGQILFNVKNGCQELFMTKMNELMNFEVEIEPYLLDMEQIINTYPDLQIDSKYFVQLDFLFME